MPALVRTAGLAILLSSLTASMAVAQTTTSAESVDGRWDATLARNGVSIPFRLDIAGSGPTLKGVFYDGFKPYDGTTSATFQDGKLVLNVEHYLTTITATLKDGQLAGNVVYQSRGAGAEYAFQASRHVDATDPSVNLPSIAGSWIIPLDSPSAKGEKAFRFIVDQRGPDVAASILRVDGDTGAYSGTYKDGKWILSHYDGSRPGVIEVSLQKDGTLQILQTSSQARPAAQDGANVAAYQTASVDTTNKSYAQEPGDSRYASKLTAYRSDVAVAKGLPEPENYETHTTARDQSEVFTFNFPDANGKLVSNQDPRFKGKVVLAIVTGTWCPNCHDEAQYLVQLDKKYRDKGLAIVALDFEEPEQQGGLEREKAFVKQYGVNYTYLIAGAPSEMWEKVPQLNNLDTWPATVFIGRDGRVKAVHSGFASPASGEFNRQLQQEFTSRIEQLLAEKPGQDLASSATAAGKPGQ
jgi:thiol-disulfide isomerase/thioredoxin